HEHRRLAENLLRSIAPADFGRGFEIEPPYEPTHLVTERAVAQHEKSKIGMDRAQAVADAGCGLDEQQGIFLGDEPPREDHPRSPRRARPKTVDIDAGAGRHRNAVRCQTFLPDGLGDTVAERFDDPRAMKRLPIERPASRRHHAAKWAGHRDDRWRRDPQPL